ncbi:MAG: OmpA family protein [Caldimonas sp.]
MSHVHAPSRAFFFRSTACAAAAAFLLGGCADLSPRERGTAVGAGAGAVGGAVIGSATGGSGGAGALIGGAVGAIAGNLWSKRQEDRRVALEQATRGSNVQVSRTADNQLMLNVPNDISFDTGSYAVRPELKHVLDQFADTLVGDPASRVSVVGHTDSTGSDQTNERLSVERAQSVRDYLAGRGVSPLRIETSGHGERDPIADNGTADGRARNRRVEIYLREPVA